MIRSARSLDVLTRLVQGRLCAYDLGSDQWGVLQPAAVFKPAPTDEAIEHAATADLRRAVYTTLDAAICLTSDGAEAWRVTFEPRSTTPYGHRPGCVLSLDGRVAWIYRPDAMAGRDRADQWVALDAETGATIAAADLETVGHGGQQFRHPAGVQVLLEVGEGQDGINIFRGALDGNHLDLFRYPWWDRCLIGLAPDGNQFMTVAHDQADVAFHAYPDGEVILTLSVEAFGHDPEVTWVEWGGGYLTQDTAVVTLVGEAEGGQWHRHYRVDQPSGQIGPEFKGLDDPCDFQPLGDGSWLTTDPSGHPTRRSTDPAVPSDE